MKYKHSCVVSLTSLFKERPKRNTPGFASPALMLIMRGGGGDCGGGALDTEPRPPGRQVPARLLTLLHPNIIQQWMVNDFAEIGM